jgi:hypothetical protein
MRTSPACEPAHKIDTLLSNLGELALFDQGSADVFGMIF